MDIASESRVIQEFVDKGNYHAAMNIAISALNDRRRNNDQFGVDVFLGVIKGISDTIITEFGS